MSPSNNAPYLQAEAFPVLTPAQIARIRLLAVVRPVRLGEVLFEPGTVGMPCYVVVLGKLEILCRDFLVSRCLRLMAPAISLAMLS